MITSEAPAAMAKRIYEQMSTRLAVVRKRLNRALTLSEKLLLGHLDQPETQALTPGESYLQLRPDRVVLQDVLGQSAFLQFMQTGRDAVAVPTSVHCDHLIVAEQGAKQDLAASFRDSQEVYDFLKSAAARYGGGFWEPGAGIIHQVVLEEYAFPGQLIIGTDSHTPNGGGLGACAVGVGGADAVETMAGLPWELLYPKRIAVYLTGQLNGWTAPKDVILWVAGQLTVSGGTNAIIEYIGPGARTISATGKATICNMGAEVGATTSMFAADEKMATYLKATGRGDVVALVEQNRALLAPDAECEADPKKHYDRVLELDLSKLEPHVSGPHSPDRSRPISELMKELAAKGDVPDNLTSVLLGSCTNSSYEDMCRAADVATQAASLGIKSTIPLMITPGSDRVRATVARDGQLEKLQAIGANVLAAACGPCIGQWNRQDATNGKPNVIVTTFNRNFPARNDGRTETMNLIVSPEIATAFAVAGRLSFNPLTDTLKTKDGQEVRLKAPAPAPEVPAKGLAQPQSLFHPPLADRSNIEVKIAPDSKRLQRLTPWSKWDGQDFVDVPVLVKTKGKTTTDHISPAGKWLTYRGHLDRFSDNLLMGAINAWTGERGTTRDVRANGEKQSIAAVARGYKARGVKWAIVGDANYGEGSSREHAALSPRLLGAAVVIARSFARIHESNLKKQGLLALTFSDPASYELIREGDRLNIRGLSDLKPGVPVTCRVEHADGTTDVIQLRHTYSTEQLNWFRAGSALNCIAQGAAA